MDYYVITALNGNIVEKYVWAGRFSFIENEIFCEFLWFEKGCTYYLYHYNTADVPYKINLSFLGDLISSEIENDVMYIDGSDLYASVHVDPIHQNGAADVVEWF